jgi:hypothetical protein
MSSKINAISTGVGGLATSADNSGVLEIQTNDTTAITVDGSQNVSVNSLNIAGQAVSGYAGFKNRIINGAMMIDQRNAGASVTINTNTDVYTVDRFLAAGQPTDGVFTVQQSTTAPAGFINSLKATVTTADASIGSAQYYFLQQKIEGLNVADLGWGAAGAQTVTLSFQVYSSLTGTFGGAITNGAFDRSYPFTYTISSANTWTTISITIAGDTSGTWLKTNGIGMRIYFGLGVGSTYSGTAGSWAGAGYLSATGATNVIATNGATFYITGVQLEKGSTATSFDYRPYGTELALCQRYLPAVSGNGNTLGFGIGYSTTSTYCTVPFLVTPRVAPTGISVSSPSHFNVADTVAVSSPASAITFINSGTSSAILSGTLSSGAVTVARPTTIASTSTSANLYFTGCEL